MQLIPYEDLMKALEVTSVRELEDLIIDAIYLDILQGTLISVNYVLNGD